MKQFNPKKGFCSEAEKMHHQAWSERKAVEQTGHPTPLVFSRRAQSSPGEQHRAPSHQILYSFSLLTSFKVWSTPCSQPCTHPSRSCGVEPTLCCCLVTFLADPAFPWRAPGRDSPGRSRTCPKTQREDSAQLQMKSTNTMFL